MRKTILGYVVVGDAGYALGKDGVLWIGDEVTLFPSHRAASRAIHRTTDYANNHGYKWDTFRMRVRRVTAPPSVGRAR